MLIEQSFILNFFSVCVLQNVPQVDAEGFCIRPEANENDILYIKLDAVSLSLQDTEELLLFVFLLTTICSLSAK